MGELARKLKKMRKDDNAAQARERAEGATKPRATKPRKQCGCGANLAGMSDTHAAQHVARCLES